MKTEGEPRVEGGREPPDAMSLPDLLDRPSIRHTVEAYLVTEPPLNNTASL